VTAASGSALQQVRASRSPDTGSELSDCARAVSLYDQMTRAVVTAGKRATGAVNTLQGDSRAVNGSIHAVPEMTSAKRLYDTAGNRSPLGD